MKKVTLFIDPESYRVDGYTYKMYNSEESAPSIPRFLVDENGQTTGVMYVPALCVVTGYSPDLLYKTYKPETKTFI